MYNRYSSSISPCFTTPVHFRNSTFTPTSNLNSASSLTCSSPFSLAKTKTGLTTTTTTPCMLLGIPRIFAPSSRPKEDQTVKTVEPAPPPPNPIDRTTEWARLHPFQAAASLSIIIFAIQKAFQLTKTNTNTNKSTKSSTSSSSSTDIKKAVPKKHETTEEALDLLGNTARKYIIVGGKGGVGKTSMSAAISTAFADRGQTTLIISTDPAHSLSDAFGQNVSGGDPIPITTVNNLYAQEIDPDSMKRTFKMMNNMNNQKNGSLGGDMGLDELNSLFETIPPGFDEAVALVEIVKYIEVDSKYKRFDRIVFDTAPTGHTLRLLSLPDFLNGFFGKIISMKSKFGNVMNQFKGMFGNDVNMDNSVEEMEELKRSMNMVRSLFRDEIQTEFIVATIPNMMAISESQRLVEELEKEKIPIRHLFLNQVQPSNEDCTFCAARFKEQQHNIGFVEKKFSNLKISMVQSFDKEITGAAALRAMAMQLFPQSGSVESGSTINGNDSSSRPSSSNENKSRDSTPMAKAELVD